MDVLVPVITHSQTLRVIQPFYISSTPGTEKSKIFFILVYLLLQTT